MLNSSSNPALTNVTFNNNSAADSGGGMFNVSSSPVLTNVTFDNNSAASYGGGIYNGSSNPTLTEVTFNSNSAYNGGGMCNYSSSPKLTHSAFNDNSATDKGGGIYNSNYSSPSLANVTFNINDANYGGGIYNNLSSPSLVNITFNANSATFRGGGVYNESSSGPTFANVILWGDSAPNGAEIYNNGTGTATVTYSNIQGGYSGTGNVNVNPLFVDASSGNLRLQSTSPVIDAGNNAAVPSGIVTDLDNNPRFVDILAIPNTGNGTVDMGAYEAQWPFKIILPLVMRGTP
jgi:predicted outer membrane repeat protein